MIVLVDFRKYPDGKDQNTAPGIELDGEYRENLDLIIALAKALIKKGVLTKAEVLAELQ